MGEETESFETPEINEEPNEEASSSVEETALESTAETSDLEEKSTVKGCNASVGLFIPDMLAMTAVAMRKRK